MSVKSTALGSDWKAYVSEEAQNQYEQDDRFKKWAHKDLAFISAASWSGVHIPADVLMQNPKIQDAQRLTELPGSSLAENPPGTNSIVDAKREQPAERLPDDEHGSAVFENGKIKKINGVEQFKGEVEQGRHACIVIGRPAGGKSRVFANPLSNRYKARIIDADIVKPWLDGFDGGNGAGFVQEESSYIMEMAFAKAIARGDNIIIPKIGGGSIVGLANVMKSNGYTVDLYYNEVSEETSIMRAASRFAEEGRYLSLNYLQSIRNKPTETFTKYAERGIFDYAEWRNNAIGFGEEPKLVWQTGRGLLASALGAAAKLERTVRRGSSDAQRYGRSTIESSGFGSTHSRRDSQVAESADRANDSISKAPHNGAFFDDFVGNDGKSFSMKPTGEITLFDSMMGNDQQTGESLAITEQELERVKAENARLSERIDALKEQFKVTKGYRPNEKALRRVARGVLKRASSKYDVDTLTEDLHGLFDAIGNQDGFDGDIIMAAAHAIARKVLEKSSERDDTAYEATKEARDYFRRARLSLTDKQKALPGRGGLLL